MFDIIKKLRTEPELCAMSGASGEQIEQAERALSLRFAVEYREYLSEFGVASACGHELTGICASPRLNVVDVTISERLSNQTIPSDWYVVEQANIDGIIVWQSGIGEVYQTTPNASPVFLCKSLFEYLEL